MCCVSRFPSVVDGVNGQKAVWPIGSIRRAGPRAQRRPAAFPEGVLGCWTRPAPSHVDLLAPARRLVREVLQRVGLIPGPPSPNQSNSMAFVLVCCARPGESALAWRTHKAAVIALIVVEGFVRGQSRAPPCRLAYLVESPAPCRAGMTTFASLSKAHSPRRESPGGLASRRTKGRNGVRLASRLSFGRAWTPERRRLPAPIARSAARCCRAPVSRVEARL